MPHSPPSVPPPTAGPWRLLIHDPDPADPKWIIATVASPGDVRPARDDGLAGLDEVTAGWAHARRLAKVPGAAVWHIDGGERR